MLMNDSLDVIEEQIRLLYQKEKVEIEGYEILAFPEFAGAIVSFLKEYYFDETSTFSFVGKPSVVHFQERGEVH